MKRVRLRVVLDDPRRRYAPGDRVPGRVEAEVDEACTCSALTVGLGWFTTGECNEASATPASRVLGRGTWRAGDRLSFPFDLALPAGPPSHRGRHFNVVWRVRAEAALDWALDPEAVQRIEVAGPPATQGGLLSKGGSGCFEVGCALACLLVLAGVVFACFHGGRVRGGQVCWVTAFGVGALVGSLWAVPRAFTYRWLGKVQVEAGPSPCPRGEELAVRIAIRPRRDLRPKEVRAALVAVEHSEKGSGKSKTTRAVEIAKCAARLDGPEALRKGQESVFAGVLGIPADAAPSLEAGPHSVKWKLHVEVVFPVAADGEWDLDVAVA